MPFVAKSRSTGQRVVITEVARPRDLDPSDLVCQFDDCGGALVVKAGLIVKPHFAHRPSSPCSTKLEAHPESAEHRAGKLSVQKWMRERLAEQGFTNVRVELEVAVREAGRVADVMVTFPGGMREAHEVQLAGITTEQLERRTKSYWDAGIAAIWWIGEGASSDTKTNREWIMRECGECPVVRFGRSEVHIAFGESPSNDGAGVLRKEA